MLKRAFSSASVAATATARIINATSANNATSFAKTNATFVSKGKKYNEKPLFLASQTTKSSFRKDFKESEWNLDETSILKRACQEPLQLPKRHDNLGNSLFQYAFSRTVSASHGPCDTMNEVDLVSINRPIDIDGSVSAVMTNSSSHHILDKLQNQVVGPQMLKDLHLARRVYWSPGIRKQQEVHKKMILKHKKAMWERREAIISAYYYNEGVDIMDPHSYHENVKTYAPHSKKALSQSKRVKIFSQSSLKQ